MQWHEFETRQPALVGIGDVTFVRWDDWLAEARGRLELITPAGRAGPLTRRRSCAEARPARR
jgi:hypothetical protein